MCDGDGSTMAVGLTHPTIGLTTAEGNTEVVNWNPYWQSFDSNPIGSIHTFSKNDLPRNYLALNGGIISRGDYPKLYTVMEDVMISDDSWNSNPEKYSDGDGSTTFRLPRITSPATGTILAVKSD